MLSIVFKPNRVLYSLWYDNKDILKLGFYKVGNNIQYRVYIGVPKEIVYQLVHHKTAAEALKTFSTLIKNKYPVSISKM